MIDHQHYFYPCDAFRQEKAGDPFLISKYQSGKKKFIPCFPCNTLAFMMVSDAHEGNNRLLFCCAHEQVRGKEALGMTGGRGRALGWEQRLVAGFLLTTSLGQAG